ncbi:sugar MFS transporter [Flavihumibacter rivuli]|uniref:sugar MFS transporter n=1 Tax=Flavihumibacter rivuli TaxID=2838156 RepID=UPI001BDE9A9C|nr:sugar MFS transporter [Flavihumibacter rivuli]ULQ55775.1 sugar MFS transporter [Flavihumibacter rivuli]
MALIGMQDTSLSSNETYNRQSYFPALCSLGVLYFLMGFITCLNDSLVPYFRNRFNLSYADSSLVQFYFFLTYGIVSIPSGRLVSRIGYRTGITLGFCITAAGAILFIPATLLDNYNYFLVALFVMAVGVVLLQVTANPYAAILGPAHKASSRLTLLQAIGSIGTTVAPIVGTAFLLSSKNVMDSNLPIQIQYAVIALVLVLIAYVVSRLSMPELNNNVSYDTNGEFSLIGNPSLLFGVIGIFMYVGAEVSIGTFLTNYISDTLQIGVDDANFFVAIYWGSMIVGRILGAYLLNSCRPALMLIFCSFTSIILILLSLATKGEIAVWSMALIGLFNSVLFAIVFSLSIKGLGKYANRASGYLSTAIVGGAIVTYLQGYVKDRYNWEMAYMIPAFCYLYLLAFGIYQIKLIFKDEK